MHVLHIVCGAFGSRLWGHLRVCGSMQPCALCKGMISVVSVAAGWMSMSVSHGCGMLTLATVVIVPPIFLGFALLNLCYGFTTAFLAM